MHLFQKSSRWLRALFQKRALDAEMDDEMRSHIDLQTQANIDSGMDPEEARYAALREFGWAESIKETCRDQRGVTWVEDLVRDVRRAVRMLRKDPGFTVVAVLTLALGIGVNLALFGILNELLIRPKPVTQPDELWAIESANAAGRPAYANVCRPYYEAIRLHPGAFKSVIGYASITPKLRTEEGTERIVAELVSGDYFSFLGVAPALGRGFLPEEDLKMGTHSVAVISHAFWKQQFAGAADVVGKTIKLNDRLVEIVGVAPKAFLGLDLIQPSVWLPSSMEALLGEFTNYQLVGRLAEPKLASAAADLLAPVVADVTTELSGFKDPQWTQYGYVPDFKAVRLDPIGRGALGTFFMKSQVIGFLQFGAVASILLLVIAAANVANLFLVRAIQRRREMATRVALGATRAVMVRQLVCEGLVVAVCGSIGALLAFSWIGGLIMRFASWWQGPALGPVPDLRVLLVAAGSALLVGVGFSLAPALQATGFEPLAALKGSERGEGCGGKRGRLWHGLIVAQVLGSLVLLCAAALCLRSMSRQLSVDVGYPSERLAIARIDLERIGFTKATVAPQLAEVVRRVALVPGVKAVGVSQTEPLSGWESAQGVSEVEGYRGPDAGNLVVSFVNLGAGAFGALGVPVLQGREMSEEDVELGRDVALVNESFVRKYWPDQPALGRHIGKSEVIGVVKDARLGRFDKPASAMMFQAGGKEGLLHARLLIRGSGDSRRLVSGVRSELARIHPKLLQGDVCTLRDTMKNALLVQRAVLHILEALAAVALALAAVGTYGVMAHLVTSRTREIGVRLAVGATRGDVMRLVLGVCVRLGLTALAIGLPLSLSAAGLLRHHLAGISPFDPVSFATAAVCLMTALVAASWLPARRASRLDPLVALRHE